MDPQRRKVLLLVGAGFGASCSHGREHPPHENGRCRDNELGEITAPEDLMREHGVLRRVLLVYEELSQRLRTRASVDPAMVTRCAAIVHTVVEEHHERDEERYIFPRLRGDRKLSQLVDVLLAQHARGREVTAEIARIASGGPTALSSGATRLAELMDEFGRMYRPHATYEDTVVFPALREVLGREGIFDLGETMEHAPGESDADQAFDDALGDLARIDATLGIADLARFTPPPVTATASDAGDAT